MQPFRSRHWEAVDHVGALGLGALAEVVVQDLTAAHADVLALREGLAHIHLAVGGRDHLHLGDLAVDNLHGEVKLVNHAQGDGATAGLW